MNKLRRLGFAHACSTGPISHWKTLAKGFSLTNSFFSSRSELEMTSLIEGFPGGSDCLQCGTPRFDPWLGKIPRRRKWQPTPVLLPGKSRQRRRLVGYSPWGHKELDTTEQLHFHFKLTQKHPSSRYFHSLSTLVLVTNYTPLVSEK